MIYIAINTKGGVGKSTFQNQIMTSYLYAKNSKKVRLIEIDDENEDSVVFSKTQIFNSENLSSTEIRKLDEIFYEDDDIILDVGGNKTATIFLEEIRKIGEFKNIVWFIPLGTGELDSTNALIVYEEILEMDKKAKIIFILSNAKTSDIEWEYMNFFGSDFLDVEFAVLKQVPKAKYIVIKSSTVINHARFCHQTFLDLAQEKTDYRKQAREAKRGEKKKPLALNRLKNEAIVFKEYLEKDVFKKLDDLLK